MNNPFSFDQNRRLPSAWNSSRLILRGKLTDRQIDRYQKAGWYSKEFRQARRDLWAKRQTKRQGNFIESNGRLIYSP